MACQKKHINEQELFQRECQHINWKALDEWPTIDACAQIKQDTLRKKCLIDCLSSCCVEQMAQVKRNADVHTGDTLWIQLKVAPQQPTQCEWSHRNSHISITETRSILDSIQKHLPPITPGTKRGVPVTTLLHIPCIVP